MITLWAVAAGAFLVLEAVTAAMTSIWFCAGALAALIAAVCKSAVWLQIALFVAVSGVCFAVLYPRLKRFVKRSGQPTNADMLIGQECTVTADICALDGTGSVYIGGKTWSAKSADGSLIAAHTTVCVKAIEGVKLIVSPVSESITNNQ